MRNDFSFFFAVTDEKFDKNDFDSKVKKSDQISTKGIEVGIFFILEINIPNLLIA